MSNLYWAALAALVFAAVAGTNAVTAPPQSEQCGAWTVFAAMCFSSALTFAAIAWWVL